MTPAELTAHVEELAERIGVKVFYDADDIFDAHYWENPRSALDPRNGVHLVPIEDLGTLQRGSEQYRFTPELVYWISMHELGHAAAGVSQSWEPAAILRDEGAAWNWAAEHTAIPLSDHLASVSVKVLEGYRAGYPYPPPEFQEAIHRFTQPELGGQS